MRPKLFVAPWSFLRVSSHGGARLAAVASLVGGVVVAGLAPRAIRSAAVRPAEPTAPLAVASGDTQVVYGPTRFDTPTGSLTLHVERFALAVVPGRRYTLRVDNGATDGSHRVSGGSVILNGSQILSSADLGSGASGWSRVVQPLSEDTIVVAVQGTAGAYVTASLLSTPDASFLVFGPERFIRPGGTPVTETRHFTISATAAAPYRMCIVNGNANGTQRISSATIMVNGVSVVTQSELNQHVGGLMKQVTLQRDNTITISLTATPGSFIDLCFNATDVTPPVITINQPANKFITREAQVGVAGSVQDETATTVKVNGQPASMSGTSFSATVALSAEGNNVIHIVATDAAGHSTDSSRTVIHDTQPPVLTLTSPADGLITKDTTATVSGTVTDLTAVTVNVNGIPLPVDSTGAFHGAVALSEGSNILTVTATDAAGNATSQVRTVIRDTHAPVLAVTAPTNGLITNHTPATLSGSVTDASAVTVAVNGTPLTVGADGHFTGSVALTEGANTLTTVATDAAGNASTDTRSVTLDTHPPALAVTAPTDGLITKQTPVTVSGTVTDATPVTVDVNGIPLPVDGAGVFTGQVPLAEGANPLTVTAHDAATNTATVVRIVTLDTHAPAIAVTQPADGDIINAASVTTTGTVTDATASTLTVNGNPAPLGSGGAFSVEVPLAPNANTITYAATDAAGNSASKSITVTRRTSNLPPDPALVASVVNRAEVTTIGDATSFLYAGATPIQTGVAAGAINPVRAAVVRGRVLDKTFASLGGATVTILGHPELGQTLSREDGGYDLAVNGGGRLTLSFVKDGYFPAQRATDVSWQDYTTLNDVILLQPDPAVTVVDLTSPAPPVARASVVSDADGSRQATLIFKPGNTATLTRPDGSTQSLTTVSVRATEYSVGDSGKLAMPAELPPASQYTYAVQLSADEQLAAGVGAQVTFAQPVPFYVENFLHVPVGTAVPTGGYDAAKGTWVPEPNGKVIKVLGKDANGRAQVDITGDGQADPPSALAALGIDDYELLQLGGTYPAGSDLWRALAPRLEPEDLNFPFIFVGTSPTDGKVKAGCSSREGDPLRCQLQAQTAFQSVGIVGSPFTLNYASDRTQGNAADRKLDITLTGPTLQAQLLRVELEVDVAGKRFTGSFPPTPNLTYAFSWDGKDIYGRLVQGTQAATVLIGYVFPVQYAAPANATDAFGLPCAPTGTGSACSIIANAQTGARAERTLVQEIVTSIGTLDATALGLGGFTLDVQNVYDPVGQVMYRGDGSRRAAAALPAGIRTIAGTGAFQGPFQPEPENVSALTQQLDPRAVVFSPDGSVYFSDRAFLLRKITPDGLLHNILGHPQNWPGVATGDGGPASAAQAGAITSVALGPDGSIYFSDVQRVRKIDPNGIVNTVAGTGTAGFSGDGGPGPQAQLTTPQGVAVGPDGSLYIADQSNRRIRRVGLDGIITTVVGDGSFCGQVGGFPTDSSFGALCGNGVPATRAKLAGPMGLAFGPDGSLYFSEPSLSRVRRVGPNGIIRTFAGSSQTQNIGDGGPATLASVRGASGVAVGPDGSVYITALQSGALADPTFRIRRVASSGIITTVVGTGAFIGNSNQRGWAGDGGPAPAAQVGQVSSVAVGPDGNFAFPDNERIRKVAGFLPGFGAGQTVIASEDGRFLYVFSSAGRHLFTLDAVTADTLLRFVYDAHLLLTSIIDRNAITTVVERDGSGAITALVAPNGQRTKVSLDANGMLAAVSDPSDQLSRFGYIGSGLLASGSDRAGREHTVTYDSIGRVLGGGDQEGGGTTRTLTQNGSTSGLTFQSILGPGSGVQMSAAPTGELNHVTVLPSGLMVQTSLAPNGTAVSRHPNGLVTTFIEKGDPRFGLQAPIDDQTATTPGGLSFSQRSVRSVALSDSSNPLSVVRQVDSLITNGRTDVEVFDKATRTVTRTSPAGRTTTGVLNESSQVISVSVPGLATVSNTYDSFGHLIRTTQGTRTTQYFYGSSGLRDSLTNALGETTRFYHNAAGATLRRVLADGREIARDPDPNGNPLSITPAGGPASLFSYDRRNLEVGFTPASVAAAHQTWVYNVAGQLSTYSRPDGSSLGFTYDDAGRRATLVAPEGTTTYQYDPATGEPLSVTTPAGVTTSYQHDGPFLTGVTWSGPVSGSVTDTYDNDMRISSETVGGVRLDRHYDADGLLTGIGTLTVSRDAGNGAITGTSLGSVSTSQAFNPYGEVAQFGSTFGGTQLLFDSYTRDDLGRVVGLNETIAGATTNYAFTYDPAGRLIAVSRNGVADASYEYDAHDNRTRVTSVNDVVTGAYDVRDQLMSYGAATFVYTPNGQLASKALSTGTVRYTYDGPGQLGNVSLPDGTEIGYRVDGEGRRVGRTVNGIAVQGFLYSGLLNIVAELDGAGNLVSRFAYGTRREVPDYMTKNGHTYRFLVDAVGSVRLVVDVSDGSIAQRLDYDPFGRVILNSNPGFQPFGFTGCLYDDRTGLTHCGRRDYDAETGRWITPDPKGFGGGAANLYEYVESDPVNFNDPEGTEYDLPSLSFSLTTEKVLTGAGIGALTGALSGCGSALLESKDGLDWKGCGKEALIEGAIGAVTGVASAGVSGFRIAGRFTTRAVKMALNCAVNGVGSAVATLAEDHPVSGEQPINPEAAASNALFWGCAFSLGADLAHVNAWLGNRFLGKFAEHLLEAVAEIDANIITAWTEPFVAKEDPPPSPSPWPSIGPQPPRLF